jgi:hypothetical protein
MYVFHDFFLSPTTCFVLTPETAFHSRGRVRRFALSEPRAQAVVRLQEYQAIFVPDRLVSNNPAELLKY